MNMCSLVSRNMVIYSVSRCSSIIRALRLGRKRHSRHFSVQGTRRCYIIVITPIVSWCGRCWLELLESTNHFILMILFIFSYPSTMFNQLIGQVGFCVDTLFCRQGSGISARKRKIKLPACTNLCYDSLLSSRLSVMTPHHQGHQSYYHNNSSCDNQHNSYHSSNNPSHNSSYIASMSSRYLTNDCNHICSIW